MSKKKYIYKDMEQQKNEIIHILSNKYYNLWMQKYKINKLDFKITHYIMNKYWSGMSLAAFKIKHTDEIGFATYDTNKYNMYDYPEEITLINTKNVSFIPRGTQVVDKDVVIGFAQSNHKSIKSMVNYYIEQLANIELVIRQNLQLHRMPWTLVATPETKQKAEDILTKILSGATSLVLEADDVAAIQVLLTEAPYIIDKLNDHKRVVEAELLEYLGCDNDTPATSTLQFETVDQVNARNEAANAYDNDITSNLQAFFDGIKDVLGVDLGFEKSQEEITSVYEDKPSKEDNNNDDK